MKTYFSFFVWIAVEVRSVQLITFLDPLLSAMPVHHYQSLCHVGDAVRRCSFITANLISGLVSTASQFNLPIRDLYQVYLKATTELCITLGKVADTTFFAYADASHGDWNDANISRAGRSDAHHLAAVDDSAIMVYFRA
jgi:hypothetical protein